jgi:Mg-chelatase subunit ChlD
VITDVVPTNMVLDPSSVRPAPAAIDGREIRWELSNVRTDLTLSYRLTPLELGIWPTNVEAWLDYLDGLDVRGRLPFPVPRVEVVAPTIIYLPFAAKEHCRPTNVRADVALVLDASSSMEGEKLAAAKRAAEAFVDRLALPADQASVISFDAEPRMLTGLTGDRIVLLDAIARIEWHPGTAIHTAIDAATDELVGPRHKDGSNRVMVLLTDGQNNDGPEPVRAAAARARSAGIIVYTVALGVDADLALMVEVAGSPHRSYVALRSEDLEEVYSNIAGTIPCVGR